MKFFLFFAIGLFCTTCVFAEVACNLQFSCDDGNSWSSQSPVLVDGNRALIVKANWKAENIEKLPGGTPVITFLYSLDRDFASANRGKRNDLTPERKFFYCQQLKTYYQNIHSQSGRFLYQVNLGKRDAGVMGERNVLEDGKWKSTELPTVSAYGPGKYDFLVIVFYYDTQGAPQKADCKFTVTIEK